jgi:S-adenosylmethionine hydrolase
MPEIVERPNGQPSIPIITLLTDFGLEDEYVGVMKGVILSINPAARLVDISHGVGRHNIEQAALILHASFRYFPKGSVHVVVVDPGVGGARRVVCLQRAGHLFLAPDNGVLTMVLDGDDVEKICAVTNDKYFIKPVSDTFHGRDIFAPVAAHLSKGLEMACLGKAFPPSRLTRFDLLAPFVSAGGELVGKVIAIDHFGNLMTNIDRAGFQAFRGDGQATEIVIRLGRSRIQGLSGSYDGVKIGAPLAIFGSRNLLEISVNQGDARARFKSRVGQTVRVIRPVKRGRRRGRA